MIAKASIIWPTIFTTGRYDEALELVKRYEPILPTDKNLPLVAGNVNAHDKHLQDAVTDYNRALELDPKMAAGYEARGFVLNDLKQPVKATEDFKTAIQLQKITAKRTLVWHFPTCSCTGRDLLWRSWT